MDRDPYYAAIVALEGYAAQLSNQAEEYRYIARRLIEAQGDPQEQRKVIDKAMSILMTHAQSLPEPVHDA